MGRVCVVAGELLFDRFDDVVGEEGLAIVLADVAVGDEAGFAAEVAGELAAEVVLDDDGVFCFAEYVDAMAHRHGSGTSQRGWAGGSFGDTGVAEELAGFVDDAVGGAPAD